MRLKSLSSWLLQLLRGERTRTSIVVGSRPVPCRRSAEANACERFLREEEILSNLQVGQIFRLLPFLTSFFVFIWIVEGFQQMSGILLVFTLLDTLFLGSTSLCMSTA